MDYSKPVLILSSPRTGSTAFCQYLFNAMRLMDRRHRGTLMEFFNTGFLQMHRHNSDPNEYVPTAELRDDARHWVEFPMLSRDGEIKSLELFYFKWDGSEAARVFECERRIALLNYALKRNNFYLLKCFADHLDVDPKISEFLARHYQVVNLERRDKALQFLSYQRCLLSKEWHLWGHKHRYTPLAKTYTVRHEEFRAWMNTYILPYEKWKAYFSSAAIKTVFFEDFNEDLRQLTGIFSLPVTLMKHVTAFNRPLETDLSWVRNLTEVQSWFEDPAPFMPMIENRENEKFV